MSGIEKRLSGINVPEMCSGHLFRPPLERERSAPGRARNLASHSVILARRAPRPVQAHSPTTSTTNEPGTYLRREPLVAGLAAGAVSGVAAER